MHPEDIGRSGIGHGYYPVTYSCERIADRGLAAAIISHYSNIMCRAEFILKIRPNYICSQQD
jgi:hypothetical protein